MKNLTLTSLTIGFSAALLIACGGGGGGINSGVNETKPANEVTDAEAEDICLATADYVESRVDAHEVRCKTDALTAGFYALAEGEEAMQETCQDEYEACLEDEPDPEEADCDGVSASVADCDDTVTVGDVQTCLEDRVDVYVDGIDELPSCSELTLEYIEDATENPPEPPEDPASCEVVYDGCPGFAM